MESGQLIVTIVGMITGISGMIVGIVGATRNKRNDDSSATASMVTMQASITVVSAKIEEVSIKLDRMQDNYSNLIADVEGLRTRCDALQMMHNELVDRVAQLEKAGAN